MSNERQLKELLTEVQSLVASVSREPSVSGSDLRRILNFLVKVIQVVDQAFRDVYATLIEFKYITIRDVNSGRVQELQKELDLLMARDRYRDAEQICTRLHFLGNQFNSQIEPIIQRTVNLRSQEWRSIFWLIDEHEGRIISLVHGTISELQDMLRWNMDDDGIRHINSIAFQKAEAIRSSLIQLETLQNKILGLSGEAGFLELTETSRGAFEREVNIFLDKSNRYSAQEMVMGNQYNFGNITGSIVNVDSMLEQVTQSIGLTHIDEQAKKQLTELLEQLRVELQKTPPINKEEAEAVAESAKALVEAGTKPQPNKTTIQITAEGLKKAAENIASVMPTVLTIAYGIVKTVFQLAGIP